MTRYYVKFFDLAPFILSYFTGPLPKGHNKHEPYLPHKVEFPAPLPYKIEMVDGEARFFPLEDCPEQQDAEILKVEFSKHDFVRDLNKLTAMGTSGPV